MDKKLADYTDEELAITAQTGLQGQQAIVESNRRLRDTITTQTASTNTMTFRIILLTVAMVILAAVQVGLIVVQVTD